MKISLEQRISDFIDSIKNVNDNRAIELSKMEVINLTNKFTLSTARSYLTEYRKQIKVNNPSILGYLALNKEQQGELAKEYTNKVSKQHSKIYRVKNTEQIIQRAVEYLDSENIIEVAVSLCFLTGRRIGEILRTAKFTNSKNSKKVMYFRGQLKTEDKSLKYEIYAIGSMRDECKAALKKIRSTLDTKNMTYKQVNDKYNTLANNKAKIIFGSVLKGVKAKDIRTHNLRALYAAVCLHLFYVPTDESKKRDETSDKFLEKILGHQDEIYTAQSYKKFNVIG